MIGKHFKISFISPSFATVSFLKLAPDITAVNHIIQMIYLLCLTGSKCIPEKLDCCRGVYKPTVWAHHQSKQATQLLHEGNVSFLLQQKSCQRKVESFTYLCTVDLLIKLSNTGIKYFNLKEQLSKKSLKHQKWKFAEILTYIKIYKWQLIQHFNTTPRLNDTHLAEYSLNDSCISPAHAQTGSNWAPVYGTPADGTETKHKRISFFSPICPLLACIRPWTIIVTLFDQFYWHSCCWFCFHVSLRLLMSGCILAEYCPWCVSCTRF